MWISSWRPSEYPSSSGPSCSLFLHGLRVGLTWIRKPQRTAMEGNPLHCIGTQFRHPHPSRSSHPSPPQQQQQVQSPVAHAIVALFVRVYWGEVKSCAASQSLLYERWLWLRAEHHHLRLTRSSSRCTADRNRVQDYCRALPPDSLIGI